MTRPGGATGSAARSPAPEDAPRSCPSAPAAPGVRLLGLLGPDGRVHNLKSVVTVDAGFLEAAAEAGPVEARMRFAGRCQTSGCAQWTGSRCGVIDKALAHIEAALPLEAGALPPCTIRQDCRWFAQTGARACGACSYIVTDRRAQVAAE
ncbi:hypothetical protein [Tabrizicola thermarum]|uniref:hypothetical protein n=1 Tax=Tabrizicola thermarum TaxID=2670345 RepID=UPI000FFC25D6|nr:hypothetical protein [Tabrizicola thermarum]